MAQAMETLSITVNRLGHWKWLTCQEARDSVQPCPLQLAEKHVRLLQRTMRRSLIPSLGSVKVQALWGGVWVSHLGMLLGVERRDCHLFKVALVPALVVTHHDFRLHFTARWHVRAGSCGGVHRHGHVFYGGGFEVSLIPWRVGGKGFSTRTVLPRALFLRFRHIDGVEIGQVLIQVEPLPASGGRSQAACSRHVSGRVYGLELVAEFWRQWWQFVRRGEVLWWGWKVTFNVIASRVIVSIDGIWICRVEGCVLINNLVIGELLNVWQGNTRHPVWCIPVVPLVEKKEKEIFSLFLSASVPWGKELSASEARHRGICASIPSACLCKPFALKTQPRPNIQALFPERGLFSRNVLVHIWHSRQQSSIRSSSTV